MQPLKSCRSAALLILAVSMASSVASAQIWNGGISTYSAVSLDQAADGRLLVAGGWNSPTLTQLAPDGRITRDFRVNGDRVRFSGAIYGAAGQIVACGSADERPWIGAFDGAGAILWQQTLTDAEGWFECVRMTSAGDYVAAGTIWDGVDINSQDTLVARIDVAGAALSLRRLGNPIRSDTSTELIALPDGGAIVASQASGVASQTTAMLSRLDAGNNLVWSYAYEWSQPLYGARVSVTTNGDFYLAAVTKGVVSGDYELAVLRLDSAGGVIWSYEFDTLSLPDFGVFLNVAKVMTTADGGCAVVIQQPTYGNPNNTSSAVMRLDSAGLLRSFRGPTYSGNQYPVDAALTADGAVVMAANDLDDDYVRIHRLNSLDRSAAHCDPGTVFSYHRREIQPTREFVVYGQRDQALNPAEPAIWIEDAGVNSVGHCGVTEKVFAANFGDGLAGSGGYQPQLTGKDGYVLGVGPVISLQECVGNGSGFLLVSLDHAITEIFGGTVYLDFVGMSWMPITAPGIPGVPGTGGFDLQVFTDLTGAGGLTIYCQALMLDGGAPQGVSLSQALTLTIEP